MSKYICAAIILLLFGGCASLDTLLTVRDGGFTATADGIVSRFHEGTAYRRPGFPVQVSVSGTHYEMGLQYGVLLKDEIVLYMEEIRMVVGVIARDAGVPEWALLSVLGTRSRELAQRIPQRFRDEIRGVSDGAGISEDLVTMLNFFSDINVWENTLSDQCMSAVVKKGDGTLIHCWNQDDSMGDLQRRFSIIIRYNPIGLNSYAEIKQLLWFGSSYGLNSRGISVSENTLTSVGYREGLPVGYLVRMILEEAESMDSVEALGKEYPVQRGTGIMVADARGGCAEIFEIVPGKPNRYARTAMGAGPLWIANRHLDPGLRKYENPFFADSLYNTHREELAVDFSRHSGENPLTLEDMIAFMREGARDDGSFDIETYQGGIDNPYTIKTVIFSSGEDGFYAAIQQGFFGAAGAFFFFPFDFSLPPKEAFPAAPLPAAARAYGELVSRIMTRDDFYAAITRLAESYPDSAFMQHALALSAFDRKEGAVWERASRSAIGLRPECGRYRLEWAAIQVAHGHSGEASSILEGLDAYTIPLYRERAIYLMLQEAVSATTDPARVDGARRELELMITRPTQREWAGSYEATLKGMFQAAP
jgi:predicted choloylglycine hydrolase